LCAAPRELVRHGRRASTTAVAGTRAAISAVVGGSRRLELRVEPFQQTAHLQEAVGELARRGGRCCCWNWRVLGRCCGVSKVCSGHTHLLGLRARSNSARGGTALRTRGGGTDQFMVAGHVDPGLNRATGTAVNRCCGDRERQGRARSSRSRCWRRRGSQLRQERLGGAQ
jgi:hypothetical protein